MDRNRACGVVASLSFGVFWSFALEKLVFESWPWWAHAAAGTVCLFLALWWMRQEDGKVPRLLRQEGWLDRDGAEQAIRQSSAFGEWLKRHAAREFATIDSLSPGDRQIARDRMLNRREPEVVMQMRREYMKQNPESHIARLDLYYEDTLKEWLIGLESEPEPSAFDALTFFQEEDP